MRPLSSSCDDTAPISSSSSLSASRSSWSSLGRSRFRRRLVAATGGTTMIGAAATGAWPDDRASRRHRTVATASRSTGVAWRWPSSCIFNTSLAAKKASTWAAVSAISPRRRRSSSDSSTWVTSVMSVWPKVAAPPLIECAVRKIAASCSMSGASVSSVSSSRSISASSSSASSKNTWKNWLISMLMPVSYCQTYAAVEMCKRPPAARPRVVPPTSADRAGLDAASTQHLADHLGQPGRVERLDQPAGGARSAALGLHLVARFGSQHQDGHPCIGW